MVFVQRELELQRKETERVQAELLTLKAENAKLVAAASKLLVLLVTILPASC